MFGFKIPRSGRSGWACFHPVYFKNLIPRKGIEYRPMNEKHSETQSEQKLSRFDFNPPRWVDQGHGAAAGALFVDFIYIASPWRWRI